MTTTTSKAFVRAAANYLIRHQRKTGKFIYRARPDNGQVQRDYNVLRHVGTLYALTQAQPLMGGKVGNVIDKGLLYLWKEYLVPIPGPEPQLAIASSRVGRRNREIAKIGAMGITLVAVASINRPLSTFEKDTCAGLVRYMLSLIRADGSMVFKLNYQTGEASSFVSLYYPGEAALGLLLYGLREDNPLAMATAINILMNLARTRFGQAKVPSDHWALLATAKAFEMSEAGKMNLPSDIRDALYHHATQVVDGITTKSSKNIGDAGCSSRDGHCCSAATTVEGLSAIQPWFAKNGHPDANYLCELTETIIGYLKGAQYTDGPTRGGIYWISPLHSAFGSDYLSPEVRIDTVQHSISAVLGEMAIAKPSLAGTGAN